MKRFFLCCVLFFMTIGMVFSQSSDDWNWGGLVRFRPLATIYSLSLGGFEVIADWIPYITPNVGIPIEVDFVSIEGVTGFGIMGGVEAIPVRYREKSGLFLTILGGPLLIGQNVMFIARADIGHQMVTDGGFVFTSAIGLNYNDLTGISLDIMLDIGFAYRRNR